MDANSQQNDAWAKVPKKLRYNVVDKFDALLFSCYFLPYQIIREEDQ